MSDFQLAPPKDPEEDAFALRALRIVFFTGFAIVATVLGFVFLPPAGFVLAGLIAWRGFHGVLWTEGDFALRALSIIAYTAFAVVATVMGFVFLPPAGFVLAAFFVWRGFGGFAGMLNPGQIAPQLDASVPASGNGAFDAYRAQTLDRLEQERQTFETFLERLRAARDKSEFDQFLDERASRARTGRTPRNEAGDDARNDAGDGIRNWDRENARDADPHRAA